MNAWIAFWSILRKDIRNYYLKPPNISWGIIFPLSWTLMQYLRTPYTQSVSIRSHRDLCHELLFGTTMLAVTMSFERRGRSLTPAAGANQHDHAGSAKIRGVFGVVIAFSPSCLRPFWLTCRESIGALR